MDMDDIERDLRYKERRAIISFWLMLSTGSHTLQRLWTHAALKEMDAAREEYRSKRKAERDAKRAAKKAAALANPSWLTRAVRRLFGIKPEP